MILLFACLFICSNMAGMRKTLFLGRRQMIQAIHRIISEKGDKMSWHIRFEGLFSFITLANQI